MRKNAWSEQVLAGLKISRPKFDLFLSFISGPIYCYDKSTSSCIAGHKLLPDPYESQRLVQDVINHVNPNLSNLVLNWKHVLVCSSDELSCHFTREFSWFSNRVLHMSSSSWFQAETFFYCGWPVCMWDSHWFPELEKGFLHKRRLRLTLWWLFIMVSALHILRFDCFSFTAFKARIDLFNDVLNYFEICVQINR